MRITLISGIILLLLNLSGCSYTEGLSFLPRAHKVDVQQGNIIEQEQVNLLRPNMSRVQVHFILGTPMLRDTFHANQWDYVYSFKPGYGESEKYRLTLIFENDRLVKMTGDFRPGVAVEQQISDEVVVVPLEDYQPEQEKGYFTRFIDFFRWTDEQRGIPQDGGDIPVNRPPNEVGPASEQDIEVAPIKL